VKATLAAYKARVTQGRDEALVALEGGPSGWAEEARRLALSGGSDLRLATHDPRLPAAEGAR
jgi:hypothetical protein